MHRIAEQVTRAMNVKGCFIRLLDRSGKILKPAAYHGLSERYARKGVVEVAKSGLDREAFAGNVVQIPDAGTDARFQYGKEAAEEGLVSVLVAPMFVEGTRPIGVLRVYTGEKREFGAEDIGFLQAIADISAIAIENARMHQTRYSDPLILSAEKYLV